MVTIGNIVKMIVLLAVLVLAGEWSFGFYGAIAGLVLAVVVIAVVIRLQRSAESDRRFDPTHETPG
jgi:predicted PurR-regulated permease PerM